MNMIDFSFEDSALDALIASVPDGGSISAVSLLTLLEDEDEDGVGEVLNLMSKRDIAIDLARLPRTGAVGEAALRLRTEEQLVESGMNVSSLDPTDPLRLYIEEVAMTPAYGDATLLAEQSASGDESAMLRLSNLCLGSVIETAKAYVGCGVLLLDLIQEGSLGLWQAIRSYRGGDFYAIADRAVHFAMAKTVLLQARENGVGQKMRTALEDYRAVDEQLLTELGRNPTLEEISEKMHLSPENTEIIQKTLENARILAQSKKLPEPEEEEIAQSQAVEDTAYFQMRQRIEALLSELDEIDAKLLTLRYGLDGAIPMSAEEAGKKLGMTPDEVLAHEVSALQKLRKS